MMTLEQINDALFYLDMKDRWDDRDRDEHRKLMAMKRKLSE